MIGPCYGTGAGTRPRVSYPHLQASWLGGRVAFSRADSLSDSHPFWARGAPAHFESCAPCTGYPLAKTVDTGSAFGNGFTTLTARKGGTTSRLRDCASPATGPRFRRLSMATQFFDGDSPCALPRHWRVQQRLRALPSASLRTNYLPSSASFERAPVLLL